MITSLSNPTYARVSEHLREDILNEVFLPEAHLRVAELKERYGVSQIPIREALQQLQGEGLVVIHPNRGAVVRKIDDRFITNMYDIRGAMEMLLIRLSIRHLTSKDVAELRIIQDNFEQSVEQNDITKCLLYNKQLHRHIYHSADNPEAVAIVERHWRLIDSLRRKYKFKTERITQVIQEHHALIQALEDNNSAEAERIVMLHSEHAKEDLLYCIHQNSS